MDTAIEEKTVTVYCSKDRAGKLQGRELREADVATLIMLFASVDLEVTIKRGPGKSMIAVAVYARDSTDEKVFHTSDLLVSALVKAGKQADPLL